MMKPTGDYLKDLLSVMGTVGKTPMPPGPMKAAGMVASGLSKQFLYDPKTQRPFPSSPAYKPLPLESVYETNPQTGQRTINRAKQTAQVDSFVKNWGPMMMLSSPEVKSPSLDELVKGIKYNAGLEIMGKRNGIGSRAGDATIPANIEQAINAIDTSSARSPAEAAQMILNGLPVELKHKEVISSIQNWGKMQQMAQQAWRDIVAKETATALPAIPKPEPVTLLGSYADGDQVTGIEQSLQKAAAENNWPAAKQLVSQLPPTNPIAKQVLSLLSRVMRYGK